jgi:hypothetical protein
MAVMADKRSGLAAAAATSLAPRLHEAMGDGHHAVSPVGAWLLLALVAPLAVGDDREELERALGCDAESARRAADELLRKPHPAVSAALAAWGAGALGPALEAWRRALPPAMATGAMPTQSVADAWALEHTHGLIAQFPATINELSRLLLASAVAVDVAWESPFFTVTSDNLGGPWAQRVGRVMREHGDGATAVARTAAAGLVGVQVKRSRTGMAVVSAIAPPDVAPSAAIAAAYEVAALVCGRGSTAGFVSLFDLPPDGHAWRIEEKEVESTRGGREERAVVTLPAWSASSSAPDLAGVPGTGFPAAGRALVALLPPDPRGYEAMAAQVTRAEFDVNGFRAASITTMDIVARSAMGWRMPSLRHKLIIRTIHLQFSRPFAAVALADDGPHAHAWQGVPVFGAWVTEPAEPGEVRHTMPETMSSRRPPERTSPRPWWRRLLG